MYRGRKAVLLVNTVSRSEGVEVKAAAGTMYYVDETTVTSAAEDGVGRRRVVGGKVEMKAFATAIIILDF